MGKNSSLNVFFGRFCRKSKQSATKIFKQPFVTQHCKGECIVYRKWQIHSNAYIKTMRDSNLLPLIFHICCIRTRSVKSERRRGKSVGRKFHRSSTQSGEHNCGPVPQNSPAANSNSSSPWGNDWPNRNQQWICMAWMSGFLHAAFRTCNLVWLYHLTPIGRG